MKELFNKTKPLLWVLTACMAAVMAALLVRRCDNARKDREIKSLRAQLDWERMAGGIRRDTVTLHDTIVAEVVTQPAVSAELRELRRQHRIDEQLISDLRLRVGQLDALQTTALQTSDSARAAYCHDNRVYSYADEWSRLEFHPHDSTFYYNIRDSLVTVVSHEYKHRFLWWRWGVKGYKVKVVNFNPHATITYNTYVRVER